MPALTVHAEVDRLVRAFVPPEPLGFGRCLAPILYRAAYRDRRWQAGEIVPYAPIALDPAAKVLHYAQVVFEGLKAYWVEQPEPALFRPEMNWQRLQRSAARMMMPAPPRERFLEGLCALTACCRPFLPRASGRALYLRPVLFGTQPALGLAPSDSYAFLVIASPCEAVASGPLRVLVEREGTRAARGGTGAAKASGNYGASLRATAEALEAGFHQVLWLDAESHRYIEELSIMNFFALIDGELHTPALDGTILPGVTRASIIELARAAGMRVHERRIAIDELEDLIESKRCTEAFACGTAAIVAPVSALGERDGRVFELPHPSGPITARLRNDLLAIQEGRAPDRFDWMQPVGIALAPG